MSDEATGGSSHWQCAHCGRPGAVMVWIGNLPYHPECSRGPYDFHHDDGLVVELVRKLRAEVEALRNDAERAVAAERDRLKARAVQIVEWHRNDYNRDQIDPIVAELRNWL